ncbi:Pre-mRNA-splicing factor SPF27 [Coniochaeta sp. 2T2.1]|nr:Pre-mRNA-splicing factor SPF27 [Coniochaeta sp. 2T2.1]
MPAITTIHESLPYIDPEPSPSERAAAESLITAERSLVPDDPYHALLPPPLSPTFSPLIQSELDRIAAKQPLKAIDLTRYEAPEAPSPSASKDELSSILRKAYASATYLSARRAHLALLDSYGKNAWLMGNYQLEQELKSLERELGETKKEIDLLAVRRRRQQEEVEGEIKGLEEGWKRGVGRVLETEVAVEGLRAQALEVRRKLA